MFRVMRGFVSFLVAISIALITPAPLHASPGSAPQHPIDDAQMTQIVRNDAQLFYWSTLAERNPLVGEAALETTGDEKRLWNISPNDPLVDKDPFFMRSQEWKDASSEDCTEGVCFEKSSQGLILQFGAIKKALLLKQAMSPILDTDEYLFLSADNLDIFRERVNEDQPGEGFFFIAKKDLLKALKFNAPIPVFFAPTVGTGWTGPQPHAFEFNLGDQMTAQYIFPDRDGDRLELDHTDIMASKKSSVQICRLRNRGARSKAMWGPMASHFLKSGPR